VPAVSVEALALAEAPPTLPIRQRQVIVLYHLVIAYDQGGQQGRARPASGALGEAAVSWRA
jgi:hypothetical protein